MQVLMCAAAILWIQGVASSIEICKSLKVPDIEKILDDIPTNSGKLESENVLVE